MSAIIACHIQENHIASGYSLQFGFFQQNQKPHTGLRQENLPHVLARFLALRLWDGHAMSMCDVCSWKWLLTKQALDLQYLRQDSVWFSVTTRNSCSNTDHINPGRTWERRMCATNVSVSTIDSSIDTLVGTIFVVVIFFTEWRFCNVHSG